MEKWKGVPVVVASLGLAACGPDAPAVGPSVEVVRIGDTTIVRTLSGSVWGRDGTLVPEASIGELDGPEEYLLGRVLGLAVDGDRNVYVLDGQAQHVRVFDETGVHVATVGGRGEGPGEFARAEAIAVLPDGRLAVRDPGNMRIQVFDPVSGETEEWAYNSGNSYRPGSPLHNDVGGRTYLSARGQSGDDVVIVLGPDGTHLDTLPEPTGDHEPAVVRAEGTNAMVIVVVPFAPSFVWTVHTSGHFLTGLSSDYRIDLARDDGLLRIERDYDPVPVSDGEAAHRRETTVRMIRRSIPGWTWDGPPIPSHKAVFDGLFAGRDGRIWVRLPTEGRRVDNVDHDPENPLSQAVSWRESTRYDVFDAEGTYLGAVAAPDALRSWPAPVFDHDHVWAVAEDELGVERVVRYRIAAGEGGGG